MARVGIEGRERYLLLACLGIISLAAVSLSYLSISHFATGVVGHLTCGNGRASLKLVSRGGSATIYYVSVVEGDDVIDLRKVGYRLGEGGILSIQLRLFPNSRVSVLMDKGVISGLTCGRSAASQP